MGKKNNNDLNLSSMSIRELLDLEDACVRVLAFIANNTDIKGDEKFVIYEEGVYIMAGKQRQKIYNELFRRIEELNEKEKKTNLKN